MKKIICLLLLAFTVHSFSQETNNDELVNWKMFEYLKAVDCETSEVRDYLISQFENLKNKSNDAKLKNDCEKQIEYLKNIKTAEAVPVDLNKASKEDLKKFRIVEDKFQDKVTIYHKNMNHKTIDLFMVIRKNKALMIISFNYKGYEWIFMNSATVLIDNEKFEYILKENDRDVVSGGVNESNSSFVTEEYFTLLNKIVNSSVDIDVRLSGKEGKFDTKLTKSNINVLREMLDLYNKIQ